MVDNPQFDIHINAPVQGLVIGDKAVSVLNFSSEQKHSQTTSYPIWNVPFPRNPFFTGREVLLQQIYESFIEIATTDSVYPVAINGLGGIGKSQIVLEYAYRHKDEYQNVFWVNAASRDILTANFIIVAELLQLMERNAQDQNIVIAAVKRWLEKKTKWLLILDNADDLALAHEFLPTTSKGHILFTTRSQATGPTLRSISIGKMDKIEGSLFLLRRAKLLTNDITLQRTNKKAKEAAENITVTLDGLPLALDQAGAYIEETGGNLLDYLGLYKARKFALLGERGSFAYDHPESVATTFSLAFQHLQQTDPAAAKLLRLCAFLNSDLIPEEIFTDYRPIPDVDPDLSPIVKDQLELNAAVKSLLKFSLVRRDLDTKTLTIHGLVQIILKDGLEQDTQRQWAELAVRYVSRSFPHPNPQTWQVCQRYLSHAYICVKYIEQWSLISIEGAGLLYRIGAYLYNLAAYSEAETFYQNALEICEKVYGPEYLGLATVLKSLADLYEKQSKFAAAEVHYQRAMELRKKVLGADDPSVIQIIADLASVYRNLANYSKAEEYYQQALKFHEKSSSLHHIELGTIYNDIGLLYRHQGRYAEAEDFYKRALVEREKERPSINLASNLSNLADLYRERARYEEAELLSTRALTISEEIQGPEHPDVAIKVNNLALIYFDQGKYIKAEELYLQAIEITKKIFDSEHSSVAVIYNNLAALYMRLNKYPEAKILLKKALAINEAFLGPEHPNIATNLDNLALCHHIQQEYIEAEKLYKRALAMWDRTLGKNPFKIKNTIMNYISLLIEIKRDSDAKKLQQKLREIEVHIRKNANRPIQQAKGDSYLRINKKASKRRKGKKN